MELGGAFLGLFFVLQHYIAGMCDQCGNSLGLSGKKTDAQPGGCIPIPAQKSISGEPLSAMGVTKGA